MSGSLGRNGDSDFDIPSTTLESPQSLIQLVSKSLFPGILHQQDAPIVRFNVGRIGLGHPVDGTWYMPQ